MSSTGSVASAAALQAADAKTDRALAEATRKLAADQRAKANAGVIRADQKAITVATRSANAIDKQVTQTSAASGPSGAISGPGVKITA